MKIYVLTKIGAFNNSTILGTWAKLDDAVDVIDRDIVDDLRLYGNISLTFLAVDDKHRPYGLGYNEFSSVVCRVHARYSMVSGDYKNIEDIYYWVLEDEV